MPGSFYSGSGRPPIDIINLFSETASHVAVTQTTQHEILSGALTADTYATALEITSGPGIIKSLAVRTKDATNRTVSIKVTIDGTVVFESTSDAFASSGEGVIAIGSTSNTGFCDTGNVIWNISFKVEIKQSLSETDKISILTTYNLT